MNSILTLREPSSRKKYVLAALGAIGTAMAALPAYAADLGGDCCADLEERIAELEATTVRKGNRKVSLEISGHVNEAVLWWDDGGESNTYIVTNDNSRTRFRFVGKAKIDKEWEAGYSIEIGVRAANSKRFDQNNDEGDATATDVGLDLRDSFWYIKGKTYGKVSVGRQASATDAITELSLAQTSNFAKYSDVEDTGLGLLLRSSANGDLTSSGISWRRLIGDGGDQPGEGERRYDLIKYESPTFVGFTVTAAWGEDDFWDIGLRYKGEFNGIKIVAGFGYGEQTDGLDTQTSCNATIPAPTPSSPTLVDQSCSQYGGSLSVLHEPTGLFINFAAGEKTDDFLNQTARFAGTGADDGQTFYAFQGGIERKFNALGKTTIYGEYYNYDGGANSRRTVDGPDGGVADALNPYAVGGDGAVWGTGVEVIGGGIAQGIDSAATIVYLSYRHVEGDLTLRQINGGVANGVIAETALEDLDLLIGGAIIKF